MDEAQRGMIVRGLSIILFLVAFGINWKANSMTNAILLLVGGAITGTAVLVATMMGEGGVVEISTMFVEIIIIGYGIIGLDIWQAVRMRH